MLLALIFLIISIVFSIVDVKIHYYHFNWEEFFGNLIVLTLIFALVYVLLAVFLSCATVKTGTSQEVLYEIQGLESKMVTEQNLNGHFILGCGTVAGSSSSNIRYYYFKKNDFGLTFETLSIIDNEIYIKETNEQSPCLIQIYQNQKANKLFKILFWDFTVKTKKGYIIVVPEDTVKIDYYVGI